MKPEITFAEFLEIEKKLEITWGYVSQVERVPKSTKMLKLLVDFGEESPRTVVTNIGGEIDDEQLLKFKSFPFVTNLVPAKIMGIESSAMIMVSVHEGKIFLSRETETVGPGAPYAGSKLL